MSVESGTRVVKHGSAIDLVSRSLSEKFATMGWTSDRLQDLLAGNLLGECWVSKRQEANEARYQNASSEIGTFACAKIVCASARDR